MTTEISPPKDNFNQDKPVRYVVLTKGIAVAAGATAVGLVLFGVGAEIALSENKEPQPAAPQPVKTKTMADKLAADITNGRPVTLLNGEITEPLKGAVTPGSERTISAPIVVPRTNKPYHGIINETNYRFFTAAQDGDGRPVVREVTYGPGGRDDALSLVGRGALLHATLQPESADQHLGQVLHAGDLGYQIDTLNGQRAPAIEAIKVADETIYLPAAD